MQTWCPSQKTNRGFGFPCARSSKQCSLVIHQQDALFRLAHVQAHLALETISHFRLIPHWKRPPCPGSSRIGQFSDLTNTPDLSDTDSAWVNRTEMIGFKLQPQTGGFKRCEAFVLAPLRLFSWVLARCWLRQSHTHWRTPSCAGHSAGHSKCGFSYQRRLGRANGPSRNCSLFQLRYWPGPWNLAHRVAPRGRYRRRQSDDYGYWRRSILRG